MASGLVWQGAQSRIIPYIVEVDEAGSVRAVGPVSDKFRPSDAQITNQLARFITNVRSISIDPVVLRQNWMQAYAFATDQASITLNSYAQANDPFAEVGQSRLFRQVRPLRSGRSLESNQNKRRGG
ncbi:MAG: hypothetical protein JKY25_10310 [Robiginitomaculum sp.]|nr:hypothetical protein [Robiginitomaculum sp.]